MDTQIRTQFLASRSAEEQTQVIAIFNKYCLDNEKKENIASWEEFVITLILA